MRVVIQRVSEAAVTIDNIKVAQIAKGLMILLGIEESDNPSDINWLIKKIVNLRIFDDNAGVMNLPILDAGGEILLVSQFTLYAQTSKGNRPSYIRAAKPDISIPLYNEFIDLLSVAMGTRIKTGQFGADMKVALINDGPVTIIIDTKNKE